MSAPRGFRSALAVAWALLLPGSVLADAASGPVPHRPASPVPISVTNLAGRAISGELQSITDSTVRLRLDSGTELDIPLSVLASGERERLRRLAGAPQEASSGERQIERDLAQALVRIDVREREGEIDKDTADQLRAEARAQAEFRKKHKSDGCADHASP